MATTKKDPTGTRVHGRPDNIVNVRDEIVSVDEVARRLGVPKTTLYGWRYKGGGPRSHRIGQAFALPVERRCRVARRPGVKDAGPAVRMPATSAHT